MRAWVTCMIYRSAVYAESVYESLMACTPEIASGDVRFTFIANDAEPALIEFLRDRYYPHLVHKNPKRTEEELFAAGYGWPEYMHRVYRCMNWTIEAAPCDTLVFVSSDNVFTPGWLGSLLPLVEVVDDGPAVGHMLDPDLREPAEEHAVTVIAYVVEARSRAIAFGVEPRLDCLRARDYEW